MEGLRKGPLGTGLVAWEGCPTSSCFLRSPFSLRPRLCTCCVPIILGGWQLSLLGHLSQPQRTPCGLPGSSFPAARSAGSVSRQCVLISMHLSLFSRLQAAAFTLILVLDMRGSFGGGAPCSPFSNTRPSLIGQGGWLWQVDLKPICQVTHQLNQISLCS